MIAKLLDGTLWGDHWQPFLLSVSQQQADDLIRQLATRELQYRDAFPARMILSSSATPALAAKIFCKLCEVQGTISAAGDQPLAWKCIHQLRDVLRAIPVETAVTGMMQSRLGQFDAVAFHAVSDIFGKVNADAAELRSAMPELLRQSVRRYLKDGIEKLLADDLFDDATRSHAAIGLARIGDPEDLVDLRRMIAADMVRHRAKSSRTTWAHGYVQALLMLDAPCNSPCPRTATSNGWGTRRISRPSGRRAPECGRRASMRHAPSNTRRLSRSESRR